jgi:hypothetical protein
MAMKLKLTLAALAAAIACAPAAAQDAPDNDDWRFVLFNSSAVSAIEFRTVRKDGQWSGNWLKTPMKPAERRTMVFKDENDRRCEVRTHIGFSDGSEFDTPIDYCGITEVIATDEQLYSK